MRTQRFDSANVSTRSVPRAARYASRLLPSSPLNSISGILFRLTFPLVGQTQYRLQIRQPIPSVSACESPKPFADTRTHTFQPVVARGSPSLVSNLHRFHIVDHW